MTDNRPYTYTVLRYVHDVTTSEFVNVGVVVHAPDARFVGTRLRTTHGRLSAMFPDLDRDAFRSTMRSIERALKVIATNYAEDDLFRAEGDAAVIARSVLPADDSALQWSPVGAGLAGDMDQLLDRLFQRLVSSYDDKPERTPRPRRMLSLPVVMPTPVVCQRPRTRLSLPVVLSYTAWNPRALLLDPVMFE